ncbi:unnamed protein product [Blepharisma stoltei]|uniref:Uncharacterized protein n=1 Tax=Blepharisma stoltei TaxID=1481888 RepID=A0AAU9IYC9_9CILI|nr:unnamed protein product [Blepharisma stoltei]
MKEFPNPFLDFFKELAHKRKQSDGNTEDGLDDDVSQTDRPLPSCRPILARPSDLHSKVLHRNSSRYSGRRKWNIPVVIPNKFLEKEFFSQDTDKSANLRDNCPFEFYESSNMIKDKQQTLIDRVNGLQEPDLLKVWIFLESECENNKSKENAILHQHKRPYSGGKSSIFQESVESKNDEMYSKIFFNQGREQSRDLEEEKKEQMLKMVSSISMIHHAPLTEKKSEDALGKPLGVSRYQRASLALLRKTKGLGPEQDRTIKLLGVNIEKLVHSQDTYKQF